MGKYIQKFKSRAMIFALGSQEAVSSLPLGWSVQGFTGKNLELLKSRYGVLSFDLKSASFVQLNGYFQIPAGNWLSEIYIDGKAVKSDSIEGEKSQRIFTGNFFAAGNHQIGLKYTCRTNPCSEAPVTIPSLKIHTAAQNAAVSRYIFDVEAWMIGSSATPFNIIGNYEFHLDGNQYFILMKSDVLELALPVDGTVTSISFTGYSENSGFRMTVAANGREVGSDHYSKKVFLSREYPLSNISNITSVKLKIKCDDGQQCLPVNLYALKMIVDITKKSTFSQIFPVSLLAILILFGMYRLLIVLNRYKR